jgi:hypothetical protein
MLLEAVRRSVYYVWASALFFLLEAVSKLLALAQA